MKIDGVLIPPKKNSKYWGIGLPILDIYTQGKSKNDALRMIEDAVFELSGIKVSANCIDGNHFFIKFNISDDFVKLYTFRNKNL